MAPTMEPEFLRSVKGERQITGVMMQLHGKDVEVFASISPLSDASWLDWQQVSEYVWGKPCWLVRE